MKVRKVKELKRALVQKGFVLNPEIDHHSYFYLVVDGKKTAVQTYFSHGESEYGKFLMSAIKRQLKFPSPDKMDEYFDCKMSYSEYVALLRKNGHI